MSQNGKKKLASIERIKKLEEIENADFLLKASILGWQVVVRKDDGFEEGDLCVYIQVDTVVPEREEFEFLRSKNFRIRTIKLRGVVSQGIAFPLDILPPKVRKNAKEGMNVTEVLGVKKYKKPVPIKLDGETVGPFPSVIPKTDEPRIQGVPDVLERHSGKEFYVTEKLDGTSATYFLNEGDFGVCSRNQQLAKDEENLFWRLAISEEIEKKMRDLGRDLAIQGEIIGKGINRNNYELDGHDLFIFNIYDIDSSSYLNYQEFKGVLEKLELTMVPLIEGRLILEHSVSDLEQLVKGKSILNPQIPREGIVVRSREEETDEEIGRLSFKVLNSDYELEYEE